MCLMKMSQSKNIIDFFFFWRFSDCFLRMTVYLIFLPLLALVSTFFLILLRSFWMASHCLWDRKLSIYNQMCTMYEWYTCTCTHSLSHGHLIIGVCCACFALNKLSKKLCKRKESFRKPWHLHVREIFKTFNFLYNFYSGERNT